MADRVGFTRNIYNFFYIWINFFFYLNNYLKKEKKEKRYNFWIRSSPLLEENKQSISYIYFKNPSYWFIEIRRLIGEIINPRIKFKSLIDM